MTRKKPRLDDLEEMRKDLDQLGVTMGLGPKGSDKPSIPNPTVKAKARPASAPPRSDPGPGKVLRGRLRKALGLGALLLALGAHPGHGAGNRDAAPADSLGSLRIMITSEFRPGDALLEIRDTRRVDSLLRNVPDRGPLLQAIRDSATARELRSRAEFDAYWDRLTSSSGHRALRGRIAAQDIDKTFIPKTYLFDSSMVVFPGWIVVRKRAR
jgi:hypothetical protein